MRKQLSELEFEFDSELNSPLTFDQLTPGRRKPVHWKCAEGHRWSASVSNRLRGSECRYCTGRQVLPGFNDLKTKYPLVASEWDYTNNPLPPEEYLPHCNDYVNWICEKGHCWKAKINNRTAGGTGCPICAGTAPLKGVNDLATVFPWLLEEWDFSQNGDKHPSDYLPKSNVSIHWRCKKGHEWETKIYHRTDGQGCPYCAGIKAIPGETDLQTLRPDLAAEWHLAGNNGALPSEFTCFSHFEAQWRCPKGHTYPSPIYRRSRGSGCSVCSGKRVVADLNSLAALAPNLALEWDAENNKGITPYQVTFHSNTKYRWKCSVCGHRWPASPNNRSAGKGCPKCHHTIVDPDVTSFAAKNPFTEKEFDLQRNAPLTARDVAAYDNRDYYWHCEYGHSWLASPANRMKGTKCPYCSGKLPIVGVNDLATRCPQLVSQWHRTRNNGKLPQDFLCYSHEPIVWICDCGHEWEDSIYSRTLGSECPYCTKQRPIVGENDLGTKYPTLAAEWHPFRNAGKCPQDYFSNSGEEIWWKCSRGHEWQRSIRLRANGSECPYCTGQLPVVGENDLASTHPALIAEWHPFRNAGKRPQDYFSNSGEEIWWKCSRGHEWQRSIKLRVNGSKCPYCTGQLPIIGENDLATQYPALAAEWHSTRNGGKLPQHYLPNSADEVWWECCSCGHEWRKKIHLRVNGSSCPACEKRRTRKSRLL